MIGITVGQGVKRPRGAFVMVNSEAGLVDAVASTLRTQPNIDERWWSPHRWQDNYRDGAKWQSSLAVAVDVDWHDSKSFPPPQTASGLEEYARTGALPGSIFHSTPHGCRVVFVFDQPCTDRASMLAASEGAAAIVQGAFADLGLGDLYKVDDKVVKDLARLFFVPTCRAKNVQRQAEVIIIRSVTYASSELSAAKPVRENVSWTDEKAARPREPIAYTDEAKRVSLIDAIKRWNADHPGNWPRNSAECPVCKDSGSFGHFPDDPARWACFSTDHPSNIGVRGPTCSHGDALDLEAFRRGVRTAEVLRQDGYLARGAQAQAVSPAVSKCGTAAPSLAPKIDYPRRPYRSNSLATAVAIIESNDRDVLDGRALEYDELQRSATLGRVAVTDTDLKTIRLNFENRFSGGVDRGGNQIGLKMSLTDIESAVDIDSHRRSFHPVREYLRSRKWDGRNRICQLPSIIKCDASPLNLALLRRWFISAVARPMSPGCQVDTMLVLQGSQGAFKSSFFDSLAGEEWFNNTHMDVYSKDACMALEGAWIVEWQELASIQNADSATVKGFITTRIDTYRRPYERTISKVRRSSVLVGSLNVDQFLDDETGEERRFWPIQVGGINKPALLEQRDHLWAEAVALYDSGEQWHLTDEEKVLLKPVHAEHAVSDAWAPLILEWAEKQLEPFTTAKVLIALEKPKGMWTQGDEKRIAKILRQGGYGRRKRHGGIREWTPLAASNDAPGGAQ
jgi:predicted P-loop ATPase